MVKLGNQGSNRWCSFYADGDYGFNPKNLKINYPLELPIIVDNSTFIQEDGSFKIDHDKIAWKINHKPKL